MNRSSLIRIFLLSGIAAAFIIGPLLQLKWFSGDLPFSPYYSAPKKPSDFVVTKVEAGAEDYLLQWPAGRNDHPPAFKLRIAPTDWFTAFSGDRPFQVREEGGSPKQFSITLLHPSSASPARGSLCRESASSDDEALIFKGCQGAMAQLQMMRYDKDWNIGFILRGEEKLPSQESLPYADRSTRGLLSFWIKRNGDEQQFAGWSCAENEESVRTEVLRFFAFPPRGAAECFRPKSWLERWRPQWFGYEQQPLYLDCQPHNGCSAYFFFRQRIAEVRYEYLAPREAAEARTALILNGWHYLENAYRQAAQPARGATVDIPEARAQLASCQTFAQQAADWTAQGEITRDNLRAGHAGYFLKASCRRVADSALLLAPGQPAVALPLLDGVIPALQQSGAVQGSNRELLGRLHVARVEALAASGQSESVAMLQAQLQALEQANAQGGIDASRINILLQRALALSHQLGKTTPGESRSALFRLVDRYYSSSTDASVWQSAYNSLIDDIASSQGQDSPELIEPLRNLGWKNWSASDFAALKKTADQLAAVMLAQPLPDMSPDSEAARKREGGAFDAVFFYRNYGFHEKRLSEAASLMAPLVARLDKSVGPEANLTKAARFHQQEVVSGRAEVGRPAGGGYLGY
ncbi:MAG: hypothetical protein REI12_02955 [Pedobacter sp.]|nr:hypothetical protein [Pedobacter sp.]